MELRIAISVVAREQIEAFELSSITEAIEHVRDTLVLPGQSAVGAHTMEIGVDAPETEIAYMLVLLASDADITTEIEEIERQAQEIHDAT